MKKKKIMGAILIIIGVVLIVFLGYPYVFILKYGFPIVITEASPFRYNYFVCQEKESGGKIYLGVYCSVDTCFESYYDKDGNFIEGGEYGPMALSLDGTTPKPETEVESCQRTTRIYFKIKTEEKSKSESTTTNTTINATTINNNEISLSCTTDEDCLLIDIYKSTACCYQNACDTIDYSDDNYVAVNKKSFLEQRGLRCGPGDIWSPQTSEEVTLKEQTCGPAPMCPTNITNKDYVAKCIEQSCKKVKKENTNQE